MKMEVILFFYKTLDHLFTTYVSLDPIPRLVHIVEDQCMSKTQLKLDQFPTLVERKTVSIITYMSHALLKRA